MEITKYLIGITALLALNMLVANRLSWVLTEWKRPIFDFKPFSCRPCLSFWLTVTQGAPLVVALSHEWNGWRSGVLIPYLFAVVVVLTAFINYLIINCKIEINE